MNLAPDISASLLSLQQSRFDRATAVPGSREAEIEKTARDFESVFLTEMLRPMFESVDFDPLSDDTVAKDIYKSMLLDEYGKVLARSNGTGIAQHVKAELLRIQEVQHDRQGGK